MNYSVGNKLIIKTIRKDTVDKRLIDVFPEHTFCGTICDLKGDFMQLNQITILQTEGNKINNKTKNIGRDKLIYAHPPKDLICIKIKNNLYFDFIINKNNINLLNEITTKNWFPLLHSICFYHLYTTELEYIRTNLIIKNI
jgi:hypothetical protein